jgi:hypothetical protein
VTVGTGPVVVRTAQARPCTMRQGRWMVAYAQCDGLAEPERHGEHAHTRADARELPDRRGAFESQQARVTRIRNSQRRDSGAGQHGSGIIAAAIMMPEEPSPPPSGP